MDANYITRRSVDIAIREGWRMEQRIGLDSRAAERLQEARRLWKAGRYQEAADRLSDF